MDFSSLANPGIVEQLPYHMNKPLELIHKDLGAKSFVRLNAGENPFGVSRKVRKLLARYEENLNYFPDSGAYYLKQELKKRRGYEISNITAGCDAQELISLLLRTFVNPTHNVIVPQVNSYNIERSVKLSGAKLVLSSVNDDWSPNFDSIISKVDVNTRMVILANPSNPIGAFLGFSLINYLMNNLPEDVLVVIDESLVDYLGEGYRDLYEIVQAFPNLILLRSFSHVWGLANLRVGYMLSCEEICGLVNVMRDPFNVSQIGLDCATVSLSDVAFYQQVIKSTNVERNRYIDFCVYYGIPMADTITCSVTIDCGDKIDTYFNGLLKHGIYTRPLGYIGLPSLLNISIGLPRENDFVLERFERVIIDDRKRTQGIEVVEEQEVEQKKKKREKLEPLPDLETWLATQPKADELEAGGVKVDGIRYAQKKPQMSADDIAQKLLKMREEKAAKAEEASAAQDDILEDDDFADDFDDADIHEAEEAIISADDCRNLVDDEDDEEVGDPFASLYAKMNFVPKQEAKSKKEPEPEPEEDTKQSAVSDLEGDYLDDDDDFEQDLDAEFPPDPMDLEDEIRSKTKSAKAAEKYLSEDYEEDLDDIDDSLDDESEDNSSSASEVENSAESSDDKAEEAAEELASSDEKMEPASKEEAEVVSEENVAEEAVEETVEEVAVEEAVSEESVEEEPSVAAESASEAVEQTQELASDVEATEATTEVDEETSVEEQATEEPAVEEDAAEVSADEEPSVAAESASETVEQAQDVVSDEEAPKAGDEVEAVEPAVEEAVAEESSEDESSADAEDANEVSKAEEPTEDKAEQENEPAPVKNVQKSYIKPTDELLDHSPWGESTISLGFGNVGQGFGLMPSLSTVSLASSDSSSSLFGEPKLSVVSAASSSEQAPKSKPSSVPDLDIVSAASGEKVQKSAPNSVPDLSVVSAASSGEQAPKAKKPSVVPDLAIVSAASGEQVRKDKKPSTVPELGVVSAASADTSAQASSLGSIQVTGQDLHWEDLAENVSFDDGSDTQFVQPSIESKHKVIELKEESAPAKKKTTKSKSTAAKPKATASKAKKKEAPSDDAKAKDNAKAKSSKDKDWKDMSDDEFLDDLMWDDESSDDN